MLENSFTIGDFRRRLVMTDIVLIIFKIDDEEGISELYNSDACIIKKCENYDEHVVKAIKFDPNSNKVFVFV